MILAVDVQYTPKTAYAAGVLFDQWESKQAGAEYVSSVTPIEQYEPGNFYKRELPCILQLIEEHKLTPTTIVVDGYVFLDGRQKPGLGKRLYDALGGKINVIGVAKAAFTGIAGDYALYRGKSKKPLYITSTGGDLVAAKRAVASMHGDNRLPTLIKRVDQLARAAAHVD